MAARLAVQRARFAALQSWGVVGWSAQGWNAVHRISGDPDQAAFVLQLADWAIDRQVRATGAFLEDLSPDEPSFNTGFIGEGVAAAWAVAARIGDSVRGPRVTASRGCAATHSCADCRYLPDDRFICADPGAALGGVRIVPSGPWIRADSVSHWLSALCTGLELDVRLARPRRDRCRWSGSRTAHGSQRAVVGSGRCRRSRTVTSAVAILVFRQCLIPPGGLS